jgi:VanZ family protein
MYIFILGIFLLYPFDLFSHVKNDVRWIKNSNGIEFLKKGQTVSNSLPQENIDRLVKGSGLTLELWLQTEDLNQTGPATIFSYSGDFALCNFIVVQLRDKLIMRLRTTKTDLYGINPHLAIPDVFTSKSMRYIGIVYKLSEQKVYINGVQKARSDTLKGSLSNWDNSYRLTIGNDVTGSRPWKGEIYYVAVYNRALTDREIHNNYLSGFQSKIKTDKPILWRKGTPKHAVFKEEDPIVRYLFNEGQGNMIHDSGSVSNPINLTIPKYISHELKPFLNASTDYLRNEARYSDIIINILIFIPLGIFLQGFLRVRYGLTMKISFATLICGTLFALIIESLQYFSATRASSLIDVATNMIGIAIGIVMEVCYIYFLNYQAKRLQMFLYDRKD